MEEGHHVSARHGEAAALEDAAETPIRRRQPSSSPHRANATQQPPVSRHTPPFRPTAVAQSEDLAALSSRIFVLANVYNDTRETMFRQKRWD